MKTSAEYEIDSDFLSAELDIACSMLQIAHGETVADLLNYQSALAAARSALGTVHRLAGRIEDIRAWRSIHTRANELKSDLAAFESVKRDSAGMGLSETR